MKIEAVSPHGAEGAERLDKKEEKVLLRGGNSGLAHNPKLRKIS